MIKELYERMIENGEMLNHEQCRESNKKVMDAMQEIRATVGDQMYNRIEDFVLDVSTGSEYSGFVIGFLYGGASVMGKKDGD